jgi:integrase
MTVEINNKASRKPVRGIFEKVAGSDDWYIRFVDGQGTYRREHAGSYASAKKLLIIRKREALDKKKLPSNLRSGTVFFSELAELAEKHIRSKYADPQHDLGRLETVKGWFGTRDASSITSHEIESALNQAKDERRWSASSYNHHRTVISLCFRLGMRADKLDRNPVRGGGVEHHREDNSRIRYLTADEETRLRQAIRSNPAWRQHEPELDLALHTGLRRKSMYLDLFWENVDLMDRVATIPRTKNDEAVHVPLNDVAMAALMIFRSRGDGTGRVVRNIEGTPLNYPTHWFVPAVRAAKLSPSFKWHDCRHTFASRLIQHGVPINEVSKLLGHKSLAMTMRYAHLAPNQLHIAVGKISDMNSTPVAPALEAEKQLAERVQ